MSDYWREHLERRRESLISQIELMRDGKFGIHEMRDGRIVDTTEESIGNAEENLAEIEEILARKE